VKKEVSDFELEILGEAEGLNYCISPWFVKE